MTVTDSESEGGSSGSTRTKLLDAARECLVAGGYAKLSTRRVAEGADAPLSQIHYHFGGKQGLLLALLQRENEALVARQRRMYGSDQPLWRRYEQACDFLDDDLASGYVRLLQEMIAAGWADPSLGGSVLMLLQQWTDVLEEVSAEAERRLGPLGPISARDLARLLGSAFLGAEQQILLGDAGHADEVRGALRRVALVIRAWEEGST